MSYTSPLTTARKRPRGISDNSPTNPPPVSMIPYEPNNNNNDNDETSNQQPSNTNEKMFDISTYVKTTAATDVLRSEITALRADLEHERSLRTLERRKAEQSDARLRRQVQFHLDEVEEVQNLLEEVRNQSENDLKKMREARSETLASLRDCEKRLAVAMNRIENGAAAAAAAGGGSFEGGESIGGGGALEQLRRRCDLLESRVSARDEEIRSLRSSLRSAEEKTVELSKRSSFSPVGAVIKDEIHTVETGFTSPAGLVEKQESTPPPSGSRGESISEITKTRIKLAEAERANRQLTRRLADSEKKAREVVQHREAAKAAKSKAERMEEELIILRREKEEGRELESRWAEFRTEIEKSFEREEEHEYERSAAASQPPEIATVLRHFHKLKQKCLYLEEQSSSIQSQLESSQRHIATLEQLKKNQTKEIEQWQNEKKDMEHRVAVSDMELGKIRAQEKIWQREADSLRSLLSTYENLHGAGSEKKKRRIALLGDNSSSSGDRGDSEGGPTSQGLRLSLDSAREQVDVLTQQNSTTKEELESTRTEMEKLKAEHERVLEKFGKLREALYAEREKAEKAEDRACQAETLAGKGSYSSETTKVLHLQENPLMAAVREKYEAEIHALKEAMEGMKGGETSFSSPKEYATSKTPPSGRKDTISALDANKINHRLKQKFKEQIGMFREGIYLLTGYKVDMILDTDRPRFKVRSMFAEREDDHLMFVWPKTKPGEEESVTSLDMLDSELARELSKTTSIEYLTKFKSLPAFMSGVTLNLFEKQTFMG